MLAVVLLRVVLLEGFLDEGFVFGLVPTTGKVFAGMEFLLPSTTLMIAFFPSLRKAMTAPSVVMPSVLLVPLNVCGLAAVGETPTLGVVMGYSTIPMMNSDPTMGVVMNFGLAMMFHSHNMASMRMSVN